jgi:hypothetical protein
MHIITTLVVETTATTLATPTKYCSQQDGKQHSGFLY